jgi:predicted regulator of Ras-like GTPase activity (Roadblock/LC7/MglB family)
VTVPRFEEAAAALRQDIAGVKRLLLCSSDGLVISDTATQTASGSSAATAAALLGLGHHAASMLGHGVFREAVLRSSDGCLIVYGVGSTQVLAVFCETLVNVPLLDRKCRVLVREMLQELEPSAA